MSGIDQKNETSFEDKLKELEAIVKSMESGEQSLEKSISDFQAGMEIVRTCQKRLSEAELQIVELTASDKGDHEEVDVSEVYSSDKEIPW